MVRKKLQEQPTSPIARSHRLPKTQRSPSASSARSRRFSVRGGGSGSGARTSSSEITERAYENALAAIAAGAEKAVTSVPAIPGPATSADDRVALSLVLASSRLRLSFTSTGT
ncbi:hypothetical protein GA0115244_108838 [Streptomyces sp. DvalAA-19]|nr:hypothetical protein GA0115244_108838 [Streptomyces sp. DvalAA-19]